MDFHLLLKVVNRLAFHIQIWVAKIIMPRLWQFFVLFILLVVFYLVYDLPGILNVSFLTFCTYFLIKNFEKLSLKPSQEHFALKNRSLLAHMTLLTSNSDVLPQFHCTLKIEFNLNDFHRCTIIFRWCCYWEELMSLAIWKIASFNNTIFCENSSNNTVLSDAFCIE